MLPSTAAVDHVSTEAACNCALKQLVITSINATNCMYLSHHMHDSLRAVQDRTGKLYGVCIMCGIMRTSREDATGCSTRCTQYKLYNRYML